MKTVFAIVVLLVAFTACNSQRGRKPVEISLTYRQNNGDIQKSFDTLYDNQQVKSGIYLGFMEQALAHCHYRNHSKKTAIQDVVSSMYFNKRAGVYDCVTTTTFRFPDGTITATGVFNLVPGSTIAPDHDFPITGGTGRYRNTYGTYTRNYSKGVYHVKLFFYKRGGNNK
jgi:hypothetical protein